MPDHLHRCTRHCKAPGSSPPSWAASLRRASHPPVCLEFSSKLPKFQPPRGLALGKQSLEPTKEAFQRDVHKDLVGDLGRLSVFNLNAHSSTTDVSGQQGIPRLRLNPLLSSLRSMAFHEPLLFRFPSKDWIMPLPHKRRSFCRSGRLLIRGRDSVRMITSRKHAH